jgi:hypothetical protein
MSPSRSSRLPRARASRCTNTSESIVPWKIEPWPSSSARIASALVRLPLWATAICERPVLAMKGCAFCRLLAPAVE